MDTALPGDQSEEGRDSQAEPGSEEGEAGLAPLRPEELRVLGCLIEKEATTPDQYPLTMNSLILACNQASNRNPVVNYAPDDVEPVLAHLRELGLVRLVYSRSNRADRYRHVANEAWGLSSGELAVLAVLALRGPQTVNELRARTERYTGLEELGGVEGILHRLKNRYEWSFVTRLDRQPGQREERWAHLLAGEVLLVPEPAGDPGRPARGGTAERLVALEQKVDELAGEVQALRAALEGSEPARPEPGPTPAGDAWTTPEA
ncbi:MAG: YceH family protein [Acidimicrobiales bacterium]|nr:YceH family protein [Acidimicrobiales bacterium]